MSFILYGIVIGVVCCALYILNFLISVTPLSIGPEKLSPYESGFEPALGEHVTNSRPKLDIMYWKIGILYLIFDLEIIYLFPLGAIMYSLEPVTGVSIYLPILVFIVFVLILTFAFIYEWFSGALVIK